MENLDSYGKVWKRSGVAFWFCFIEQKSVGVERPIFKTMTDYFIVQNCFKAESRGACTFGKISPSFIGAVEVCLQTTISCYRAGRILGALSDFYSSVL